MKNQATNDLKKTGFEVWLEKEYNEAQKERNQFKIADMRKAYEAAYRVAFGLIEKGVEHAWKEGYVVGFNEGKTYTEVDRETVAVDDSTI